MNIWLKNDWFDHSQYKTTKNKFWRWTNRNDRFIWLFFFLFEQNLTSIWIEQCMNVLNVNVWWHHRLAVMIFRHPCQGNNQHLSNASQLATDKFQLFFFYFCINQSKWFTMKANNFPFHINHHHHHQKHKYRKEKQNKKKL